MSGIEAGKAYLKYMLDDSELKKSLKAVGTKLRNVGKIGMTAMAPMIAVFTAATAAFVDAGSQLDDMSKKTGFSAESLSELKYAADQTGTSLGGIEKAAKKMAVGLFDAAKGTGTLFESLHTLGVTIEQLEALSPEQQFLTLARAIAAVEDPTTRAALAQKVFGRAGTELLPLLSEGAAGLDALRARAHELGVTMSGEAATAAEDLGDNIADVKSQVYALGVQLGAAVAGPLKEWLVSMQGVLGATIDWIKTHPELVANVAKITTVLFGVAAATYAVGTALTLIAAHPIVAFLAVLAAATWAVVDAWQWWADLCDRVAQSLYGVEEAQYKLNETRSAGGLANIDSIAAEGAAIQAQAQASLPDVSAAAATSATAAALEQTLGRGIDAVAENTEKTVKALRDLIFLVRNGRGAGLPGGTG